MGASLRFTPLMTKNMESVTTIGWSLSSTISSPLTTPTAAPTTMRMGRATTPPRPSGVSQTAKRTLHKVMTGLMDMSSPPRPLTIEGTLAIAAIASGAKDANWSVRPKLGWIARSIARNSAARIREKA